jgi:hypothetical protein
MLKFGWATITAERICLLQLEDCARQLELAPEEPIRLVQAAKSLHLSLQAALTFALAGSAGIGAYSDNLRVKWLEFLERNREPFVEVSLSRRVLEFRALLERLEKPKAIEWLSDSIKLSDDDREKLGKLAFIRDEFEHPKPGSHSFEPDWACPAFAPAAQLTLRLIRAVHHRFEPEEIVLAELMVTRIVDATTAL